MKLYSYNGVPDTKFLTDELYLKSAYYGIEYFWLTQYINLKDIRFVMISEAPLWNVTDSYFYNPNSKDTKFFSVADLDYVLKSKITTKQQMLVELNKIGFIILDIFPFAFNNNKGTTTQYHYDYNKLMKLKGINTFLNDIFNYYLMYKLDLIASKRGEHIKFFYRYNKVLPIKKYVELKLLQKGLISKNQLRKLPSVHSSYQALDKIKLGKLIP